MLLTVVFEVYDKLFLLLDHRVDLLQFVDVRLVNGSFGKTLNQRVAWLEQVEHQNQELAVFSLGEHGFGSQIELLLVELGLTADLVQVDKAVHVPVLHG